jgi:hypothetical protein
MHGSLRRSISGILALTLLLSCAPAFSASATPGGRIEGRLLDPSGRPAAGYEVVLVEADGEPVASAATTREGLYTFGDVAAGRYAMGIRNPEGALAPVAAEPVAVAGGQLVRRDVALVRSNAQQVGDAAVDYGLGTWWVSRTSAEKTWTVVGMVGGLVLLFFLLEDDDDDDDVTTQQEPTASAILP